MATNVFAVAKSTDVTMSIVEDNVCTIKLNEKYDLNDPDRGGECVYLFVKPIF